MVSFSPTKPTNLWKVSQYTQIRCTFSLTSRSLLCFSIHCHVCCLSIIVCNLCCVYPTWIVWDLSDLQLWLKFGVVLWICYLEFFSCFWDVRLYVMDVFILNWSFLKYFGCVLTSFFFYLCCFMCIYMNPHALFYVKRVYVLPLMSLMWIAL